jgi:hypothetical protein
MVSKVEAGIPGAEGGESEMVLGRAGMGTPMEERRTGGRVVAGAAVSSGVTGLVVEYGAVLLAAGARAGGRWAGGLHGAGRGWFGGHQWTAARCGPGARKEQ